VIQVELSLWEDLSAVLATIPVSKEDISSSESHLSSREAIVVQQLDDSRDTDGPPRRMDEGVVGLRGKITPVLEGIRPEIRSDRTGAARAEQPEGTSHTGDLYRLVETVENKNRALGHCAPLAASSHALQDGRSAGSPLPPAGPVPPGCPALDRQPDKAIQKIRIS